MRVVVVDSTLHGFFSNGSNDSHVELAGMWSNAHETEEKYALVDQAESFASGLNCE
jgi:hypothetical protein